MASSLFKPITEAIIALDGSITSQLTLPSRTLDTVVTESGWEAADFNFMHMNIQGAELMALKGGKKTLSHLEGVLLEKNLVSRYEDLPPTDNTCYPTALK